MSSRADSLMSIYNFQVLPGQVYYLQVRKKDLCLNL